MEFQKHRNLIKNPCGQEGFNHWTKDLNGGDGWAVETFPGSCGINFPNAEVKQYFVTSFQPCVKSQTIDLVAEGYSEKLLDTDQPTIMVDDWYAARTDAGCSYQLCVQLQGANHEVMSEFKIVNPISIPKSSDGSWRKISHTFSGYGPGVRYIMFQHGGKDLPVWKGWFGVRVTDSHVTIRL